MLHLIIHVDQEMRKSLNTSRLIKKKVQVKRGGKVVEQMRWVRPDQAEPSRAKAANKVVSGRKRREHDQTQASRQPVGNPDPDDKRGSKHGYGVHNITSGDTVEFKNHNGRPLKGKVVDDTRYDGVIVQTESGQKHPVSWREITNFEGDKSNTKELPASTPKADKSYVEPAKFTAGDWKKAHDDPNANPIQIIDEAEKSIPGVHRAINITQKRLENIEQTIQKYRVSGEGAAAVYTPERMKKHKEIFDHFLSPEKVMAATPENGEKPAFIMLGGRGGSGKSWFKDQVYDEHKCVVLDADEIKGMLGEYEGWNAAQVHEESSDILENILQSARELGVNVVLDATMKTQKSALAKVNYFKEKDYSFEAHYMHLPRQEAAKRAIGRFMGKTNRYVPVEVVLGNTGNEDTFDSVKGLADAWSFRDNNVGKGEQPILISNNGKGRFEKMMKALLKAISKGVYSKVKGGSKMEQSDKNTDAYDYYDNKMPTPDDKVNPEYKKWLEELKAKTKKGTGAKAQK